MKFKKGDKVKVVKILESEFITLPVDQLINQIGIIGSVDLDDKEYPYYVKFDNKEINKHGNDYWMEDELELDCYD